MNENHITVSPADMEPDIGNAPFPEEATSRPDPPVRIHIHSLRHRLADADGISGKAVIDGLTHAGIFPSDSPENVKEVTYSQEKTKGAEFTEITITGWSGFIPD